MKKVLWLFTCLLFTALVVDAKTLTEKFYTASEYTDYYESKKIFDNSTLELEDGSKIVVGSSDKLTPDVTTNGKTDAVIIKYNKNKEIEWKKLYGGSEEDKFSYIVSANDGYVVLGTTSSKDIIGNERESDLYISSDLIFVKYDFDGNIVWQNRYTKYNRYTDIPESMVKTLDEGFVIVGSSRNNWVQNPNSSSEEYKKNFRDNFILKVDKNGTIVWDTEYFENDEYTTIFYDVVATKDGGYVAVGNMLSIDANSKYYTYGIIIKFDSNGKVLWKQLDGGLDGDETGHKGTPEYRKVILTEQDQIIVVGTTMFDTDYKIIKQPNTAYYNYQANLKILDNTGKVLYDKRYGGSEREIFTDVKLENDILYIYGESSSNDFKELPNVNGDFLLKIFYQVDVSKKESSHGTFDIEYKEDKINVIINPDDGYELDDIIILDSDGLRIEFFEENGTNYFKTDKDVTVEVTFKRKVVQQQEVDNPETESFKMFGLLIVLIFSLVSIRVLLKNKSYFI